MHIYQSEFNEKIRTLVLDGLKEYDSEIIGKCGIEDPTSFYITNPAQEIISVIVIQKFWGALHIRNLWTHKNYRNKGYATMLMNKNENLNCVAHLMLQ